MLKRRIAIGLVAFMVTSGMLGDTIQPEKRFETSPPPHFSSTHEASLWYFISRNMVGPDGGVYTNYLKGAPSKRGEASGHAVLSESVGLMLQYAQKSRDEQLFMTEVNLLQTHFLSDGICQWVYPDKARKPVNSTIDDLRIMEYLLLGSSTFHDNQAKMTALKIASGLIKYNESVGVLLNYSHFSQPGMNAATDVSSLNIVAMNLVSKYDSRFQAIATRSKDILAQALLSNGLYAKVYFARQRHFKDDSRGNAIAVATNMDNQLIAAIHAHEAGLATHRFTRRMKALLVQNHGRLYTTIGQNGAFVNHVESPAVYALAAQYFYKCGCLPQAKACLMRLTSLQATVRSAAKNLYGGFIDVQTKEAYSFDQLEALIALREGYKRLQ